MPFACELITVAYYEDVRDEKRATLPSSTSYDMAIGLQQISQSSVYDCSPELSSSNMEICSQQWGHVKKYSSNINMLFAELAV